MNSRLFLLASFMAGLALFLSAVPATATFPGTNGRIAFVMGPDIYTVNPDGSDVKQLTNLGSDSSAFWQSWSADGKLIVFNEFRPPDFLGQIWVMNADGTNQRLVLAEQQSSDERPSFSPDGNTILFSRCPTALLDTCAVYRMSLQGTSLTQITPTTLGISDRSPVYSPDGESISFLSLGRDGLVSAVEVMAADGSNLRTLTPAPISGFRPTWSPDGRSIAFGTHCCNPQNQEIWVMNANGNGLHALTHNGNDYFAGPHDSDPSWSPDGEAIVFERQSPDFSTSSLWIITLKGNGEQQIANVVQSRTLRVSRVQRSTNSLKPSGDGRRLEQIEQGGFLPRWGPASN